MLVGVGNLVDVGEAMVEGRLDVVVVVVVDVEVVVVDVEVVVGEVVDVII